MGWVERSKVEEAARMYAENRPSIIQCGNGPEHGANSFQTLRAICILRAITGNVDVKGGGVLLRFPPIMRPGEFMLLKEFPREAERTIGSEYKLAFRSAFIPTHSVIRSMLEEKPYPLRSMLLFGTNPLLTYPDSKRTREALSKLDFLAVSDLFMTPTAELADVILPAATAFEFNEIGPYSSSI